MYGFFLGPNCKAPEHARFLPGGEEGSSCVGEVDIARWTVYGPAKTLSRGDWDKGDLSSVVTFK